MKFIQALKTMIAYRKVFKTSKFVCFANDETYDLYSFACSYRAQESASKFYCAFNHGTTLEEAKELIHYSEALRETITSVIMNRMLTVRAEEFDFTLDADAVRFFQEFEDQDRNLTAAKLYPKNYGVMMIQLLSLKVGQAYYLFLKREKGYQKEWKDFVGDLVRVDGFAEPPHTALKYWLANLTFPESVWLDKKIIGLMNEGKQRIETFGRQDLRISN